MKTGQETEMTGKFYAELEKIAGENHVFRDEPMKNHTTFRVGGPADILVQTGKEELPRVVRICRQQEIPLYIIGNGSNLLVGDRGIRGVVAELTTEKASISVEGTRLRADAGTLLGRAAKTAANAGLTGMEFVAGIPGTLGGAVVMNAGAYGGEIKDILVSVMVLDEAGAAEEWPAEKLDLGYRHSNILQQHRIVTEAVLQLAEGVQQEICEKMDFLAEQRREKQPLAYPSAGSTFKRPEGYFAGKLIMDAGLRGYRVGGAQISEKHCGFVVNTGNATAADIRRLMDKVIAEVERRFGVILEPEVKMLGEF